MYPTSYIVSSWKCSEKLNVLSYPLPFPRAALVGQKLGLRLGSLFQRNVSLRKIICHSSLTKRWRAATDHHFRHLCVTRNPKPYCVHNVVLQCRWSYLHSQLLQQHDDTSNHEQDSRLLTLECDSREAGVACTQQLTQRGQANTATAAAVPACCS